MIENQMRMAHGTLICTLRGDFVASPEVNQMREALWKSCADANVHLILDFEKVDRFDSSGLGLLTLILGKLSSMGRRFIIVRPSAVLRKTLNVTKLDTLIPVFDSLEEAEQAIRRGGDESPPTGATQAEQKQSSANPSPERSGEKAAESEAQQPEALAPSAASGPEEKPQSGGE